MLKSYVLILQNLQTGLSTRCANVLAGFAITDNMMCAGQAPAENGKLPSIPAVDACKPSYYSSA